MKKILVGLGCAVVLTGCGAVSTPENSTAADADAWQYEDFPEVGMSLKLPPNVVLGDNFWVDVEPIVELPEEGPLGFDQKTANFNNDALAAGEYGQAVDWPLPVSKKVRAIWDVNAQDFVVLGRFDVCDVALDRTVYFLKNGYQVLISSSVPRNEVMWMLPDELLTTDPENCGDEPVWADGAPERLGQMLKTGVAVEPVQAWYDQFDAIIDTLEFYE